MTKCLEKCHEISVFRQDRQDTSSPSRGSSPPTRSSEEVMELKDDFQKNLPRSAEYRECLDVSRRKTKSPKIEGDPNNFCCTKLTTFRHISLRAVWPGPGLECF
jgi:hypothetical protein